MWNVIVYGLVAAPSYFEKITTTLKVYLWKQSTVSCDSQSQMGFNMRNAVGCWEFLLKFQQENKYFYFQVIWVDRYYV